MSLIILTGIDRIFPFASEQDCKSITAVVQELQTQNIPLILISNQTRAEVENFLQQLQIQTPFIVEQGSGVFIPQGNTDFNLEETSTVDGYKLYQLGCSYTEARAALKAVQEEINKILRGFGDMDEVNIQSLIGSSTSAARRAKAREFSEYFLTPNRLEIEQLQQVAEEYGFRITYDAHLSLIASAEAEISAAVSWLIQNFVTTDNNLRTVGLGSTETDLAMLETVEIPIVIPSVEGVDPALADRDWQVAAVSIHGWLESIKQVCSQYF